MDRAGMFHHRPDPRERRQLYTRQENRSTSCNTTTRLDDTIRRPSSLMRMYPEQDCQSRKQWQLWVVPPPSHVQGTIGVPRFQEGTWVIYPTKTEAQL